MGNDLARTARLGRIVAEYGWPTRTLVRDDGATAARAIAQHSDLDPTFQQEMLEVMRKAAAAVKRTVMSLPTDRPGGQRRETPNLRHADGMHAGRQVPARGARRTRPGGPAARPSERPRHGRAGYRHRAAGCRSARVGALNVPQTACRRFSAIQRVA